jgi:hypothetical protein
LPVSHAAVPALSKISANTKKKSIPERKPPYFLPVQALKINKGSDIFPIDHKLPSLSPLRIVDSSVI